MHQLLPSVTNKPLVKVIAIVGLIILSFWIASFFPDLVLTIIVSYILAFILKPLVRFIEYNFGFRRWLSILTVFLLIGGITALILVGSVPIIVKRLELMYAQLQKFPFEEKLTIVARDLALGIPFVDPSTIGDKVQSIIQSVSQSFGEVIGKAASYLVNIVIIPFITYFILAEGDIAIKKLVERIPNKYFEMTLNIIDKLQRELVSYVRGLILECSIVGGIYTIGFLIIGVPYALLLGVITGIANLVPYIGPIAGTGLAVIASLIKFGDFRQLFDLFVLYIVIRLIDDLVLQPKCFGKTLNMHPVAVVLTLIIGHQLMGIAGMVISIPVATVLRVSARETYWGFKNYSITA